MEKIVVGIASFLFVMIIASIINSGISSKRGRAGKRAQRKINKTNNDLIELKRLHQQGILNKNEFLEKSFNLEQNKIDYTIEQKLNENEEYKKILSAYKKGFITESEKTYKIEAIRDEIKRNL